MTSHFAETPPPPPPRSKATLNCLPHPRLLDRNLACQARCPPPPPRNVRLYLADACSAPAFLSSVIPLLGWVQQC